jgi:hypothetical protein
MRRIVAEISKAWPANERAGTHLAAAFESVIDVNEDRGYMLESWKMMSVSVPGVAVPGIVETIIAVFVKKATVD